MNRHIQSETSIALGGLIAMAAAVGIGRFVYTPILPFMEESLGLTKPDASIIASANFLGYLIGALAASMESLPGGRRGWFLTGLAMSAITTAAMGLTDSLAAFLGLRLVGGVASAFVLVFASALVLDRLAAAGRPSLSAVHFAGVGCGIAISAVIVAGLAAYGYGWRAQWFASGAAALLGFLALLRLIPTGPVPARPATPPSPQAPGPSLIALIAAYGLFGFGYIITATFISSMVRASPDLRPVEPVVWLAVGLSAIPSVALWTWIGRRFGNHRSFAIACLFESAGVAMSVLASGAAAIVAAAALLGGTFMGITALGLINARQLSSGDPRRNLGLMTAAFGLGQIIGPSFAGFAHGISDSFLAPSMVAAAALAIAALLVMVPHRTAGASRNNGLTKSKL